MASKSEIAHFWGREDYSILDCVFPFVARVTKKTFHLLLHQFSRVAKSLTAIVIIVRFQFRELNSLLLPPLAEKSWPGSVVVVGSEGGATHQQKRCRFSSSFRFGIFARRNDRTDIWLLFWISSQC